MVGAVLFDLDETLLDRTTSLRTFLADHYDRYDARLGDGSFDVWCDRFLTLDARGQAHKSLVYPIILAEFGGDASATAALRPRTVASKPESRKCNFGVLDDWNTDE